MIIRAMAESDLPELHRLLSDERVMRYLEPVFDLEKTRAFLEEAGLCADPLVWAVEDGDRFIGYVIRHDYDEESREIGWVLLPEYWGIGYAVRLTKMLVQEAFSDGKQAVIECAADHAVTKHIALKLGFEFDGMRGKCEVYRKRLPKAGCIRRAGEGDAFRLAEIEIFNYRMYFYPIFRTDVYFFHELSVPALIEEYRAQPGSVQNSFVYDDDIIKGFVRVNGQWIEKLFVEPVFHDIFIGGLLLDHAVRETGADRLLVLEKNPRAVRFYERHGFRVTDERQRVDDTNEFFIVMKR